jgi:hypothetical protein
MRLLIVILFYPFTVICIEMFFNIIFEKICRVVFTSQKAEITRRLNKKRYIYYVIKTDLMTTMIKIACKIYKIRIVNVYSITEYSSPNLVMSSLSFTFELQ